MYRSQPACGESIRLVVGKRRFDSLVKSDQKTLGFTASLLGVQH